MLLRSVDAVFKTRREEARSYESGGRDQRPNHAGAAALADNDEMPDDDILDYDKMPDDDVENTAGAAVPRPAAAPALRNGAVSTGAEGKSRNEPTGSADENPQIEPTGKAEENS